MIKRDKYDFLIGSYNIIALIIVKRKRIYTGGNLCRNFKWAIFLLYQDDHQLFLSRFARTSLR